MCAGSNENDKILLLVYRVDEQKISPDMAFAVVGLLTRQLVILVFRRERGIVRDEKNHGRLEFDHVVSTGTREPIPVLLKLPGVARLPRQRCPF